MPNRNDRVILDTNIWISLLINKDFSPFDQILADKQATLLVSQELINEFIEVTRRPKFKRFFSPSDMQALLLSMSSIAVFIEVTGTVQVCRDEKDNFLLALAKEGKASHILTGDSDLLDLKKFGKTKILTIREYLS
jgi:putative PIN family toxin of toxin-antitoxin system